MIPTDIQYTNRTIIMAVWGIGLVGCPEGKRKVHVFSRIIATWN
jgi:hypothetical protein